MRVGKALIFLITLVVSVNVGLYVIVSNRRPVDFRRPLEDNTEDVALLKQISELERKLADQLELQRDIVRVLREEAERWKDKKDNAKQNTEVRIQEGAEKVPVQIANATEKKPDPEDVKEKQDKPENKTLSAAEAAAKPASQSEPEKPAVSAPINVDPSAIPVLVMACNRPDFVSRTLDELVKVRGEDVRLHPIVVSQDCRDAQTERTIRRHMSDIALYVQQPDQTPYNLPPNQHQFEGYYKISRHYRFAIGHVFSQFSKADALIIVEDDLSFAPDFFEYFRASLELMKKDKSLWCVSAWNDNGKTNLVIQNDTILHRTDFFPGLGWLLTRDIWADLAPRWPKAYWDDWMRQPDQRKGRACIRPEIGRTSTFGRAGVSNGQFFEKFLQYVKHAESLVRFTQLDLSYLLKEHYDPYLQREVYSNSVAMTLEELQAAMKNIPDDWASKPAIRVEYTTQPSFDSVANAFELMRDYKNGVPRTAYLGVVPFAVNGRRVYLAPVAGWKGYDESWKTPS